jgi:two-component system sensor histidine kinase DesK
VAGERFSWTRRRQVLASGAGLLWLGYLVPVVYEVVTWHRPWPVTAASAALLALFVAAYVRLNWVGLRAPYRAAAPFALVVLVGSAVALLWPLGTTWLLTYPFYLGASLPFQLPRRYWLPTQAVNVLVFVLLAWRYRLPTGELIGVTATLVGISFVVAMFAWTVFLMVQLRLAREELARLAVAEERLRIARDLHDVLGHRLAAIALKSDLARRLMPADPDRAVVEMVETGAVAREALDEVRATVSGFREASLSGELGTARALLVAAGVDPVVLPPEHELPRPVAEVAGWVVREGVTNIVRHANASRVRIKVVAGDPVVVEVADDGRGATAPPVSRGNGLTGLTERVAALGGHLEIGPVDGMFRLRAEIPTA